MYRVLIQAGHYPDSGAAGYVNETDINWNIANQTANLLRSYGIEVVVYGDEFWDYSHFDCAVFIHSNAGGGDYFLVESFEEDYSAGLEAIVEKWYALSGIPLNQYINPNLYHYYGFRRIDWRNVPAVIIEVGFVDNERNAALLKDSIYESSLLASAILEFLDASTNVEIKSRRNKSMIEQGKQDSGGWYKVGWLTPRNYPGLDHCALIVTAQDATANIGLYLERLVGGNKDGIKDLGAFKTDETKAVSLAFLPEDTTGMLWLKVDSRILDASVRTIFK